MIFVFGSNLAGRHGAGAAKIALEKHGAIYGQGVGLQGADIAPMFNQAPSNNCFFDSKWAPYLDKGFHFWGTF